MKEFSISIPATINDIKIKDWQRFQKVLDDNKDDKNKDDFLKMKMIQIFCNISLEDIKLIPLSSYNDILIHLNNLISEKPKRVNSFKLIGSDDVEVEFGLIPNLDEMSYGEFIDLENYLFDSDKGIVDYSKAHKAMAVLYRPILYKKGNAYHIDRYKGSEHLSDIMKDAPLSAYLGSQVFFWNLAKKLGLYTMDYTLKQLQKTSEETLENHSEENGQNINQSIHWHREILRNLIKLQP